MSTCVTRAYVVHAADIFLQLLRCGVDVAVGHERVAEAAADGLEGLDQVRDVDLLGFLDVLLLVVHCELLVLAVGLELALLAVREESDEGFLEVLEVFFAHGLHLFDADELVDVDGLDVFPSEGLGWVKKAYS